MRIDYFLWERISMKIIKRSGAEAVFDISKIIIAINKANHEVVEAERLTADQIKEIAQYIEDNYGLQSKLTDEQKQSWTDACDAWADEESSLMAEWEKYKKENE